MPGGDVLYNAHRSMSWINRGIFSRAGFDVTCLSFLQLLREYLLVIVAKDERNEYTEWKWLCEQDYLSYANAFPYFPCCNLNKTS